MICFKDVSLKFGEKEIFSNFSTNIEKGEKIVFSGRSGTGKSSFLKLIIGFCLPDNGEIIIDNLPVNVDNIKAIRSIISYIPQQVVLPDLSAKEFIEEITSFEINFQADKNYFFHLLNKFEITDELLTKSMTNLSGGERQRIAIAASLCLKRKILLLDEAASGLDEKMRKIVIDEISNSPETVIVVSHNKEWLDSKKFKKGML